MKILDVRPLALSDVKAIRFARFVDHRGYFTEQFRQSDFETHDATDFLRGVRFVQANESFSRAGTIRGLHFQWNPYMGKLVRTLFGRTIDLFLDVRKGSPTWGQIAAYDLPAAAGEAHHDWIWVPPGFAHGIVLTDDSLVEYFCSGEYSPGCEAGISPFAPDLDWSRCDPELKAAVDALAANDPIVSDKDRDGLSLGDWKRDERSDQFVYGQLP